MSNKQESEDVFTVDLVKKYPKSNRRLSLNVAKYGILSDEDEKKSQCVHISPHGVQFRSSDQYTEGDLLKIHVPIPNYWERKQRFVDYGRVDQPGDLKILAKVVSSEEVGKRGKKKIVLARTVNMDEVDEMVLKAFLRE